ncbi:dGTP triphosphohydrolase [Roseateles sp. BYS180W]|uniref:dGTP triphosphohydrolase n=1 Tax=Roseateles rivi TaxID=3299028 RepID=A0ABW7FT34_9BURK
MSSVSTPSTAAPAPNPMSALRELLQWQVRRSGAEIARARGSYRNPFARERARVLHSRVFRHLQAKEMWPGLDDGAVMRTRMTLTLETAQLARGLMRALEGLHSKAEPWRALLPDPNLLEAASFTRELGAPPLGRGGERALNQALHEAGGFESGAQSLRQLARTEPYSEGFGLDPSRRLLLASLINPAPWRMLCGGWMSAHDPDSEDQIDWTPPRGYYDQDEEIVRWALLPASSADSQRLLKPALAPSATAHGRAGRSSFDASLVVLARAIARGVHELEDAVHLGLVRREHWSSISADAGWRDATGLGDMQQLADQLFSFGAVSKRSFGALINAMVVSVDIHTQADLEEPLLRYNATLMPEAMDLLNQLLALLEQHVYRSERLLNAEARGATVMQELFEAYAADPYALLPSDQLQTMEAAATAHERLRLVADHLASLGDIQLLRQHQRLLGGYG